MAEEKALWQQHISTIVIVGGAVGAAARLITISGGDLNTSRAVLQQQGVGTVLVGTALAFMPLVCLVGVALIVYMRETSVPTRWIAFAAWALVLIAILLVPLGSVALTAVLIGGFLVVDRRRSRRLERSGLPPEHLAVERARHKRQTTWAATLVALIAGGTVLVAGAPWMPIEVVEINGQQRLAYVLDSDSGSASLLDAETFHVEYFLEPIEDRRLCSLDRWWFQRTLGSLINGWTPYEPCRTPDEPEPSELPTEGSGT